MAIYNIYSVPDATSLEARWWCHRDEPKAQATLGHGYKSLRYWALSQQMQVASICFPHWPASALHDCSTMLPNTTKHLLWIQHISVSDYFNDNQPHKRALPSVEVFPSFCMDQPGKALNTYQEKSGNPSSKSLCLQMPHQGLRGIQQEHNRLVVDVDWGDGIQVQSNLGSHRKKREILVRAFRENCLEHLEFHFTVCC